MSSDKVWTGCKRIVTAIHTYSVDENRYIREYNRTFIEIMERDPKRAMVEHKIIVRIPWKLVVAFEF